MRFPTVSVFTCAVIIVSVQLYMKTPMRNQLFCLYMLRKVELQSLYVGLLVQLGKNQTNFSCLHDILKDRNLTFKMHVNTLNDLM